jgi:hypothetical protein
MRWVGGNNERFFTHFSASQSGRGGSSGLAYTAFAREKNDAGVLVLHSTLKMKMVKKLLS